MLLEEIAGALGLPWEGDGELEILGLAGLADAGPSDLSFVASTHHLAAFRASKAAAYILPPDIDRGGRPCLRSPAPYVDFARAVDLFYPLRGRPRPGVHPTAVIESDVVLGRDVSIGPFVVVGEGCWIGERSVLYPHVTVYANVRIGADCEIHAGAHLRENVRLGDRVVVQNGAVLGGEGFGFAFHPDGRRVRVPHRCGVELGDEVEIGSNSTIDAAHPGHPRRGHESTRTRLGPAVKIDNLVQVGHGVVIEEGTTVCASSALGGSSQLGRHAYLAGGVICNSRTEIGERSFVGGGAGVTGRLAPGSSVMGRPAMDRKLFARVAAAWKRLPELLRRVRRIEQKLGLDRGGD
ncbi:MAG: UDP-3-O-(3-hydroxymyristoyl)glucosamine N-acyltransferase [Myxococcota bacterium]